MNKSLELRAKRAKLIEDARALISVDEASAENNAKFDAMMAEADGLKAQIDRIEIADAQFAANAEALRAAGKAAGVSADEMGERQQLEASTFAAWVRRGPAALNAEQTEVFNARFKAAQSTGTDTAGGYTVPQGFYDQIMSAEKAYGGMLDVAFVFDTATGNVLPIPTDNDTTNSGAILGENSQATAQDVSFGSVSMNAWTYSSKLVLVSNQLLQDTAFNLDSFLADKLGTRIARATNAHFTTGNGASQPTGVVTAGAAGYTAGGSSTSGSTTTISYADLVELEHSVDSAYRRNARWMMSDTALKVIKKLVDGMGRPLWMAGLQVKEPDTINGYAYSINQDMAVPAASAKTVLFGDFSKYFIRRVAGVQLLRLTERYADYNQTGFLAFQRWDGQLVDAGTHPVKYLTQAAS